MSKAESGFLKVDLQAISKRAFEKALEDAKMESRRLSPGNANWQLLLPVFQSIDSFIKQCNHTDYIKKMLKIKFYDILIQNIHQIMSKAISEKENMEIDKTEQIDFQKLREKIEAEKSWQTTDYWRQISSDFTFMKSVENETIAVLSEEEFESAFMTDCWFWNKKDGFEKIKSTLHKAFKGGYLNVHLVLLNRYEIFANDGNIIPTIFQTEISMNCCGLIVGPYLLQWDQFGLIVPKLVSEFYDKAIIPLNTIEYDKSGNLIPVKISSKKFNTIVKFICEWNRNIEFDYNIKFVKESKKANPAHFIEQLLHILNIKMNWIPWGPLDKYWNKLSESTLGKDIIISDLCHQEIYISSKHDLELFKSQIIENKQIMDKQNSKNEQLVEIQCLVSAVERIIQYSKELQPTIY